MTQGRIRFEFKKLDTDRRLVTAWASVVTSASGAPVVDFEDDIILIEDLEKAFIEAFADGGLKKGGEMHADIGGVDIVQQFTFSAEEREALGFGKGPEGGIVKLRINDDAIWARVKSGELSELSIAGEGERVAA